MRRRTYLASAVSTALVLAGCSTTAPGHDTAALSSAEPPGTTDEPSTKWTATTDCDPMHENVVKVEWTTDDIRDDYSPIPFSSLTAGEQRLLETVVEDGGFATCEVTDAFRSIVDRVMKHRQEQDEFLVYLEYEGSYYGLYVQQGDQVFSAG